MAIKSMTGFGRGESEREGRQWSVEVRSVNNRYLDVKMKLPHGYTPFEERIRKKVAELHQRGRIELLLFVSGDFSDLQEIKLNTGLATRYRDALVNLADSLQLSGELTPALLASFPEVIVREQKDEDLDVIWPGVEKGIDMALQNCDRMRLEEGGALAGDLRSRLDSFSQTVDSIEKSIPIIAQQKQNTLQERLVKLLGSVQLDPARLAQEVAVMADKSDVTEEIVRLRSHMQQLARFLEEDGGVGRKLDFLIQEFLREVNTLASKISDATIAHQAVELKSELEKMREQVQNIE